MIHIHGRKTPSISKNKSSPYPLGYDLDGRLGMECTGNLLRSENSERNHVPVIPTVNGKARSVNKNQYKSVSMGMELTGTCSRTGNVELKQAQEIPVHALARISPIPYPYSSWP